MKGENDLDDSHRKVPDRSSSDDGLYSEFLELTVKFGKDMKDVEEDSGDLISLIDWFEKSDILKRLNALWARVDDQLKSVCSRHSVSFWKLMTLMNSEDNQVIEEFRQFMSSGKAINNLVKQCDDKEKYSELMDLAGTELRKIKHEFPSQVGIMTTPSELHSITELFLSFLRGLKSLLCKINMIKLHVMYKFPCRSRPELQEFVYRMLWPVEDEVEQYEQQLEEAGAKIKQVLKENQKKKALEEEKQGDHDDDATGNEQRQLQSLDLKCREWLNIVEGEYSQSIVSRKLHS